jgi:hypothetical protein
MQKNMSNKNIYLMIFFSKIDLYIKIELYK